MTGERPGPLIIERGSRKSQPPRVRTDRGWELRVAFVEVPATARAQRNPDTVSFQFRCVRHLLPLNIAEMLRRRVASAVAAATADRTRS